MCSEIAAVLKGTIAISPVVTLIIAVAAVKIARIRAAERARTDVDGRI